MTETKKENKKLKSGHIELIFIFDGEEPHYLNRQALSNGQVMSALKAVIGYWLILILLRLIASLYVLISACLKHWLSALMPLRKNSI